MGNAQSGTAIDRLSALTDLTVTRIGAEEVLSRLRRGEPIVFIDARREEEWKAATEKLPGAVRLAPDRADETLPILRRGYTAVVYCASAAEGSSVTAAELLFAQGYDDVHVLYGGLAAWRLAGGPMEPM